MLVVLFDGVCNLCNGSVNWLIDHDKKNKFQFASLQSDYGQKVIAQFQLQGDHMDTVLLQEGDKIFMRSEAILRICKNLGGIYLLLYALIITPAFIRDFVYKIVANNRYRWFGKQETCRVPSPELKEKFLG